MRKTIHEKEIIEEYGTYDLAEWRHWVSHEIKRDDVHKSRISTDSISTGDIVTLRDEKGERYENLIVFKESEFEEKIKLISDRFFIELPDEGKPIFMLRRRQGGLVAW